MKLKKCKNLAMSAKEEMTEHLINSVSILEFLSLCLISLNS